METLGKKISKLRDLRGLTQEQLSAKAKVARRTLQNIEGGKVMSPGVDIISALAKQLGTTVSEIIGEKSADESKNELIAKIVIGLPALDYDELNAVSSSIADLIAARPSKSKTTLTK